MCIGDFSRYLRISVVCVKFVAWLIFTPIQRKLNMASIFIEYFCKNQTFFDKKEGIYVEKVSMSISNGEFMLYQLVFSLAKRLFLTNFFFIF